MKNKTNLLKRKATVILLAMTLIVLSLLMMSCKRDGSAETSDTTGAATSADTTAETTADTEAPAPSSTGMTVFANGKISCDIVISDKASSVISGTANDLKNAFKDEWNASSNVRKEGTFKTLNGGTLDVPKIVVGAIDDDYAQTLKDGLTDGGDYVISVKDGSLYIIGKTDASTAVAVNKFIGFYVHSGLTELKLSEGEVPYNYDNYDGITIAGNPLVEYSIVYYNSYYAKACAQTIQTVLDEQFGITLPMVTDSHAQSEYEILVGKTNRIEAKELRGAYDRPNVYYDVKTVGDKLVVMGEGYTTLTKLTTFMAGYLGDTTEETDVVGDILTGSVLAEIDAIDSMTGALERSESADMRVLHWNMAAPLSWDQSGESWGANWPFSDDATGRKMRGEQQADMVLIYNPDIFTTNEIYFDHAGGAQYDAVVKELSEHFTLIKSEYDTRDDDMPEDVPTQPEDNSVYGQTQQIFIRKGMFDVVDSGWRYLSDDTNYHGIHWAVLETSDGQKFIASVAHYSDARTEVTWGSEHLSAVRFAQQCSGSSTALPVVLLGDMFTYVNHSASSAGATYYYLEGKGYNDAQVSTAFNCNDDRGTKHGTFHNPMNDSNKSRASEDFVWYNDKLVSSKFGVIVTPATTNTSDHWPVFADLSFTVT